MPLAYEYYLQAQELIMGGRCRETRLAMGLPPATGLEDCEFEKCNRACKCKGDL